MEDVLKKLMDFEKREKRMERRIEALEKEVQLLKDAKRVVPFDELPEFIQTVDHTDIPYCTYELLLSLTSKTTTQASILKAIKTATNFTRNGIAKSNLYFTDTQTSYRLTESGWLKEKGECLGILINKFNKEAILEALIYRKVVEVVVPINRSYDREEFGDGSEEEVCDD